MNVGTLLGWRVGAVPDDEQVVTKHLHLATFLSLRHAMLYLVPTTPVSLSVDVPCLALYTMTCSLFALAHLLCLPALLALLYNALLCRASLCHAFACFALLRSAPFCVALF